MSLPLATPRFPASPKGRNPDKVAPKPRTTLSYPEVVALEVARAKMSGSNTYHKPANPPKTKCQMFHERVLAYLTAEPKPAKDIADHCAGNICRSNIAAEMRRLEHWGEIVRSTNERKQIFWRLADKKGKNDVD